MEQNEEEGGGPGRERMMEDHATWTTKEIVGSTSLVVVVLALVGIQRIVGISLSFHI